jgi:hypothetical protein
MVFSGFLLQSQKEYHVNPVKINILFSLRALRLCGEKNKTVKGGLLR